MLKADEVRLSLNIKVDTSEEYYKNLILPKKNKRELNEFIVDLIKVYYESEQVKEIVDSAIIGDVEEVESLYNAINSKEKGILTFSNSIRDLISVNALEKEDKNENDKESLLSSSVIRLENKLDFVVEQLKSGNFEVKNNNINSSIELEVKKEAEVVKDMDIKLKSNPEIDMDEEFEIFDNEEEFIVKDNRDNDADTAFNKLIGSLGF